mmetsp:Transcript_56832/g.133819  ORF Transcript_56832/g.133819 Transcript_56832/m.133819 type:complete len:85 (-) Transcript_56832:45-299(-)
MLGFQCTGLHKQAGGDLGGDCTEFRVLQIRDVNARGADSDGKFHVTVVIPGADLVLSTQDPQIYDLFVARLQTVVHVAQQRMFA